MLITLRNWDIKLLRYITGRHRRFFLDRVMSTVSNPYIFIIPAVLLGLYIIWWNWHVAWRLIVIGGIGAAAADSFSSMVLKKFIKNQRPAGQFKDICKVGNFAASSNSFPSNHAANTAAIGLALGYFFHPFIWLVLTGVLLVGYARVYCGAHFPSDVLAGWVIGLSTSSIMIAIFHAVGLL